MISTSEIIQPPAWELGRNFSQELIEKGFLINGCYLDEVEIAEHLGLEIKENYHFFIDTIEDQEIFYKCPAQLLPDQKIISVAMSPSPHRRRMLIFHEIAHALIPSHQGKFNSSKLSESEYKKMENEADEFAMELIFPYPIFKKNIESIPPTESGIEELNQKYKAYTTITSKHYGRIAKKL